MFLGDDHLLCIDSTGFAEDYRRFYFADIQAILVRRTDRGKVWNLSLGIVAGVSGLIGLGLSGAGAITLWSIAGFFGLCLFINALRGPTCVCHLRTAVHGEELPSLNRLRIARRVLRRLKPLMDQSQGVLTPHDIELQMSMPSEDSGSGQLRRQHSPEASMQKAFEENASSYQGGFHWILFALLFVNAAETLTAIFVRHVAIAFMGSLIMGALGICTVLSLVRQQGSRLSNRVRSVTWATLVYVGLGFLLAYVMLVAISMRSPGIGNDQWRYLKIFAEMSPFDLPWLMALHIYGFVTPLILAVAGMVALGSGRRKSPTTEQNVQPTDRPGIGLKVD
jgi:hypothetical protein